MLNAIYIVIFVFFMLSCKTSTNVQSGAFNKTKWLSSSDYRYELIKGEDFPSLEGKTKKQIKEILGEPDFISDKRYTYCLDIQEKEENLSKCKGSFLIISTEKDMPKKYKIIVVNVDPLYNNNGAR